MTTVCLQIRLIVFCARCANCALEAQHLRKLRLPFVNPQYIRKILSTMRKICARLYLFPQCAIYAQDCTSSCNVQYMRKICARLYVFPHEWAIYAQDLRKIVLFSPMRNICARFVQDCTFFSNGQYMCKIVLLSTMR